MVSGVLLTRLSFTDSKTGDPDSPTYDQVIENMVQSQYWAGYYRGYYDAMKKLGKDSEG
jgi:hypothetical protein